MADREKILTESGLRRVVSALRGKILLATGDIEAEGDAPLSLWRERTETGVTLRGSVDMSGYVTYPSMDEAVGYLEADIGRKQDALTAGEGIKIEGNVISADGELSLTTYSEEVAYKEDGSIDDSEARIKTYVGGEKNFVDVQMDGESFCVNVVENGNTIGRLRIDNDGQVEITGDELGFNKSDILYEAHASWQDLLAKVAALETKEEASEAREELSGEIAKKQDKLTAGENITIEGNVISAAGGSGDAELSGRFASLVRILEGTDIDVAPKFSAGDVSGMTARIDDAELSFGFAPTADLGVYPESALENVMDFMVVYFAKFDSYSHDWTFSKVSNNNVLLSENVDIQGVYPKGFKGLPLGEDYELGATEGDAVYMRYYAAYHRYSETTEVEAVEGEPVEVCWIKLPLVRDNSGSLTVGDITTMDELDVTVGKWD